MRLSHKIVWGGLSALFIAGGVNVYQHGHEIRVSPKKIEEEIDRAAAKMKEQLPDGDKQGSKPSAQALGQKIDNKIDQTRSEIRGMSKDARGQAEKARQDTASSMNKAVDKFDKEVSEGASKAKGGISSWFGGGGGGK